MKVAQWGKDRKTFEDAVASSLTIRDALERLGVNPRGASYQVFHRYVAVYECDTSHFKGKAHGRGSRPATKEEFMARLIDDPSLGTRLRPAIFKHGIKEQECEWCGITEWRGLPAPLEIDHVNGVRWDNRLENLRVLCPNCHAQTSTYRGKNIAKPLAPDRTGTGLLS